MSYKNIFFDKKAKQIHISSEYGYEVFEYEPYFYVKTNEYTGLKSLYGDNVKKITNSGKLFYFQRNNITTFESDVRTETQFLVDHFWEEKEPAKNNKIVFIDIETEIDRSRGFSKPNNPFNRITAITCKTYGTNEITTFLLDLNNDYKNKNSYNFVRVFSDELTMLKEFLVWWNYDCKPDIVSGWNSNGFDLPYIYKRLERLFGENNLCNNLSPISNVFYNPKKNKVSIAMISTLDYLILYKKFNPEQKPSYKLDNVAEDELGEKKVQYEGTLQDLYERDIDEYVRYNIQDVDLLLKFEDKFKFITRTISLAKIGNVQYEEALSAVSLTDGLCLTFSKEQGIILQDKPNKYFSKFFDQEDIDKETEKDIEDKIVGAYVKPSKKGRYKWTFDLDLTSLYPSIIMTNNISPETKFAKIRNYIDVWMEKEKTHFRINHEIFDPKKEYPDLDREINIIVDFEDNSRSLKIKTMGDLYSFVHEYNLTFSGNGIFYKKDEKGLIPKIIEYLFEKRTQFKDLRDKYIDENDKEKADYYDNEQWKTKIVLNSIYGVLTNKYFRFFDKDNAQSITLTGRFVNQSAIHEVQKRHHEYKDFVKSKEEIYIPKDVRPLFLDPIFTGDTDSLIMSAVPSLYYKFGNEWESWNNEKIIKNIYDITHNVRDYVNERIVNFSKSWLNSENNKLFFKEEWISEVSFFLGVKKRYANRLKLKEGKETDKMDIKGLDAVRSSFPKVCQKFMKELLDKILHFEDKKEIDNFVLNFYSFLKNNYKNDLTLISSISSANNLIKYTNKHKVPKKGTPIHVKGAIHYNNLLSSFKQYTTVQSISEGDKIMYVYLNQNPYGFDCFSIPLDYLVPDEIMEFVLSNINVNHTVESLLDNKIEKYYEALDWNLPKQNQQEDLLKELFGI